MRKSDIATLIQTALNEYPKFSDLNLTVGRPVQVCSDGVLKPVHFALSTEALTPVQTEQFALCLIEGNRRLISDLIAHGSCDLSYQQPSGPRFRVNIFSQRGAYSIVMRQLSSKIPTIKEMKMPECFYKMAQEKNGIVLFVGATGSGKSTSLAAILDVVNNSAPLHVVTLEDPIEFVHPHKKATFNQRELGLDFDQFASGLRAALRQAPHVILVGEIRDKETMEIALNAADTGHLVFSTLHTVNAGQAINRILGMFSIEEERQIRSRLADTIRWIVAQRLLPKIGGGRAAAYEILHTNLQIKTLIMHGESEDKTFYDTLEKGSAYDMQTFDQHILRLFEQNFITEQTALAYASSKARVRQGVDMIKSKRGEKTTDIEGLSIDSDWDEAIS